MNSRIREILEKMERGVWGIDFPEFSYGEQDAEEFLKFVDYYNFYGNKYFIYGDNVYEYTEDEIDGGIDDGTLWHIHSLEKFKNEVKDLLNSLNKIEEN